MAIRMKALKSFGVQNANEGHVSRGREFTAAHEYRARDLEALGLAYRLETKMMPAPKNKMEPPAPANKAAEAGPLDSAGGTTGAAAPAPSSQAAPRRRRQRSTNSADDLLS